MVIVSPAFFVIEPLLQPPKVKPAFESPVDEASVSDSLYLFVPLEGVVPVAPLMSYLYESVNGDHCAVIVKFESDAGTVHVAPPPYVVVPSLHPVNE